MSSYGRQDSEWVELEEAGRTYLIEVARRGEDTSYTELNRELVERTGLPGFDFSSELGRAAMGHLLYLIVSRDYPDSGFMLSALVHYVGGNEPGPGFYALGKDKGLFHASGDKLAFWVTQLQGIYAAYAR
ncbi:hypothetical protein [Cellulomonas fengjieae]|uniref:Uncharacterized protein n=1 Tax=Cellulomonas fengjieae TaxID=2819978 RepID=A0ABS3SEE1_9CELL|nr:hypothetical protein [Cellulomonas fengjieae]MBO3084117.1 hypothetical protein [Cellulomonas fengjieae]QVI64628.1 hypothetical protein KG102_10570 [Cellulomonas fengjieae]